MYTPQHKRRIIDGECSHLVNGGLEECPNHATKYWVFLEQAVDLGLDIVMIVPVCVSHVHSMRASLAAKLSWLNRDDWDLIDRSSSSFSLIEGSLE